MRDVAIVSFAQTATRMEEQRNEVEILLPVVQEAVEKSGLSKREIGFTCSGSNDYLEGQAFAFVSGVDALGAWPPIMESHVEMDAAWALYEAWVKIQHGACDSALIYGFGKSSPGEIRDVMTLQLDPYYLTPLWPDTVSLAALQAQALIDAGKASERDFAEVAARSRRDALDNPHAHVAHDRTPEQILSGDMMVSPLRRDDCCPISDGAAAVVIAEGDVAELHAQFTPQEGILRDPLGLKNDVRINPSGGALGANVIMAAGLVRLGEAARRIWDGSANRTLAHATSGPCLQHNLVCVMEGE